MAAHSDISTDIARRPGHFEPGRHALAAIMPPLREVSLVAGTARLVPLIDGLRWSHDQSGHFRYHRSSDREQMLTDHGWRDMEDH